MPAVGTGYSFRGAGGSMSIRAITIELYRAMKRVEQLEGRLAALQPGAPETDRLRDEIRIAKAERVRLKAMLEGAKE